MKLRFLAVPLFLAGTLAVNAGAFEGKDCPPDGPRGPMKTEQFEGKRFEKLAQELKLTDQQKAQFQEHRKQQTEQRKAMGEKLRANREAMRAELEKPELDRSAIGKLTQELKELEASRVDAHVNGILEMRKVLTPGQVQKLNGLMEARKGHMKDDRGKGQRGQRRGGSRSGAPGGQCPHCGR